MKVKFLVFYILLASTVAISAEKEKNINERIELLQEIIDMVKRDHIQPKTDDELFKAAINGMLSSLDPHSSWLDSKTYENMKISTKGKFGGLGIEVTMDNGNVRVVAPINDTPAERAGVLAGDLITHLDDKPILGATLTQAVQIMRGLPNTKLKLTIKREGRKAPLFITITRAIIKIKAVVEKNFGDIAYFRLTVFNELATRGLAKSIKLAQEKHQPKAYILDLRNNPGGLLNQAISVSDLFLQKGEIVSIRGRDRPNWAQVNDRYYARSGDITNGKPIIVLINGGSASASEIVAGALQDHHRAITLGTLSFGKGSVQTVRALGEGNGALRLTTARYFTPSGRSIQARGVLPDIVVEQKLDKKQKAKLGIAGETDLRGHLKNDPSKISPRKKRSGSSYYLPKEQEKDVQLNHALDLLRGVIKAEVNIAAY